MKKRLAVLIFFILSTGGCSVFSYSHISSDGASGPYAHIGRDAVLLQCYKTYWHVQIPGPDWKVVSATYRNGTSGFCYSLWNERQKLACSVGIERMNKCKTPRECREYAWQKLNPEILNPLDVSDFDVNGFSVRRFFLRDSGGGKKLTLLAQTIHKGYWIDIYLSSAQVSPDDQSVMENILQSITFVTIWGRQV